MKELMIPFAIDPNGSEVDIADADSKGKYLCVECYGDISVVSPKNRRRHFKHYKRPPNCTTGESEEHVFAKREMYRIGKRLLEDSDYRFYIKLPCSGTCNKLFRVELIRPTCIHKDREFEIAGPTGRLRYPDVAFESDGKIWVIEIRKSNRISSDKIEDLNNATPNIDFWIEINSQHILSDHNDFLVASKYGPEIWCGNASCSLYPVLNEEKHYDGESVVRCSGSIDACSSNVEKKTLEKKYDGEIVIDNDCFYEYLEASRSCDISHFQQLSYQRGKVIERQRAERLRAARQQEERRRAAQQQAEDESAHKAAMKQHVHKASILDAKIGAIFRSDNFSSIRESALNDSIASICEMIRYDYDTFKVEERIKRLELELEEARKDMKEDHAKKPIDSTIGTVPVKPFGSNTEETKICEAGGEEVDDGRNDKEPWWKLTRHRGEEKNDYNSYNGAKKLIDECTRRILASADDEDDA